MIESLIVFAVVVVLCLGVGGVADTIAARRFSRKLRGYGWKYGPKR